MKTRGSMMRRQGQQNSPGMRPVEPKQFRSGDVVAVSVGVDTMKKRMGREYFVSQLGLVCSATDTDRMPPDAPSGRVLRYSGNGVVVVQFSYIPRAIEPQFPLRLSLPQSTLVKVSPGTQRCDPAVYGSPGSPLTLTSPLTESSVAVMCVVCGQMTTRYKPRRSGNKCLGCVGKKSSPTLKQRSQP